MFENQSVFGMVLPFFLFHIQQRREAIVQETDIVQSTQGVKTRGAFPKTRHQTHSESSGQAYPKCEEVGDRRCFHMAVVHK